MTDTYNGVQPLRSDPADNHYPITPGSTPLSPRPRSLKNTTNTEGSVTVEDGDGTSITYAIEAFGELPFRATKVTASTVALAAWY